MTENRCSVCGSPLQQDGRWPDLLKLGTRGRHSVEGQCPRCGSISATSSGQTSRWSVLGVVRGATGGLGIVIGVLLLVPIVGFVALVVIGPLTVVRACVLEGEFLRAGVLAAFVASYTVIGIRSAVRRELGAEVVFGIIGLLVVFGWMASHFLR